MIVECGVQKAVVDVGDGDEDGLKGGEDGRRARARRKELSPWTRTANEKLFEENCFFAKITTISSALLRLVCASIRARHLSLDHGHVLDDDKRRRR